MNYTLIGWRRNGEKINRGIGRIDEGVIDDLKGSSFSALSTRVTIASDERGNFYLAYREGNPDNLQVGIL